MLLSHNVRYMVARQGIIIVLENKLENLKCSRPPHRQQDTSHICDRDNSTHCIGFLRPFKTIFDFYSVRTVHTYIRIEYSRLQ